MKHKVLGLMRRVGLLVLVVWTVVSLVTLLIELVPGDPAVMDDIQKYGSQFQQIFKIN